MTEPNLVKVVIDTPGVLDDVAAKALDLYREALKDWTPSRGMAAGTGFHTERSWE